MKYFLSILIMIITFASCDTGKKVTENKSATETNDTIVIANEALEYEILIIEPGFNSWMSTQKPIGYYGQTYLESKNRYFVQEYNNRVRNFQKYDRKLYEQEINYELGVDYGLEVNYQLYHYFIYFQERYKQRFRGARG